MKRYALSACLIILCCGLIPWAGAQSPGAPDTSAGEESSAPAPGFSDKEQSPAPSIEPFPIPVPEKKTEIRARYALGLVSGAPADLADDHIRAVTRGAFAAWNKPLVQVAWYVTGNAPGQGVLAVSESRDGRNVTIARPHNPEEALFLERCLGFSTSPTALSRAYLDNEISADDDFQGKSVLFEGHVADIARGAGSRPYAFFPSKESEVTGLTCYFSGKDPLLRKIRKGMTVKVHGTVKGFLMQDVVLENCVILTVHE